MKRRVRETGGALGSALGVAATTAAALFVAAGCATQGRYAQEVSEARARAAQAWGQERATPREAPRRMEGKLTLTEALALALQHNTELQAAALEREVARGRVLESYGQALPRITANAGYTRLDEVNRLDFGDQSLPLGFENNYAADVTVKQPLFHGGAIPAALRIAKLYALWSDETIRAAAQGVIFQTTKDYYDVLLAQELVRVHEQAFKFAEALLGDVQRKRANGLSSDYDVLRAEVEVSNARAELIRYQNAHNLAAARLLKTMGVSQDSRVTPADELAFEAEPATLSEAMRTAWRNRPELYQAEFAVRMQREAVRVARSAYEPKLDAFATQKWANPDPHSSMEDEWGEAWTAGLSLTLPIFDGFERRGRLAQEQARLEQARTRLLGQEEAVELDVQQAVLSLQDAEELVASQRMNLQRAEEGLRLIQAGYRQGVNTEVAVMDAQTALTRTRALYYQALHAHMTARVNLRRAVGTLGPERGAGTESAPDPAAPNGVLQDTTTTEN